MAIFNTIFEASHSVRTDILDEEMANANLPDVSDTLAEPDVGDDIVKEYVEFTYGLESAMYIADIHLESAAYYGDSVEAVTENVLTDALQKAKDGIIKLWNKIREWVRKMTSSLKAFASASTLFIKKHGGEIETRFKDRGQVSGKEYKYSGYKYDEALLSKAVDNIKSLGTELSDGNTTSSTGMDAPTSGDMAELYSDIGKMFAPKSNAYSLSELGSEIAKACRGEKVDDEKPSPSEVSKWIDIVKDAKTTINDLMQAELSTKIVFEKIVAQLKKYEKEAKKDDKDVRAGKIHNAIKFNQTMASITSKVTTVLVNCRCEQYKALSKRLKDIYNLKEPEKEATEEGYSLLTAAFNMI